MRIVREEGLSCLEDLWFDEDFLIRRVGVECLVNMLSCEKVSSFSFFSFFFFFFFFFFVFFKEKQIKKKKKKWG